MAAKTAWGQLLPSSYDQFLWRKNFRQLRIRCLPSSICFISACPDDKIYVYVNDSAHDRTPYVFVELFADSLQDCIHKCFGNQFCYSLKYDVSAVERCSLYYFAAYNCTGQELVLANSVHYNGGATTIDCLRCPANGDFGMSSLRLGKCTCADVDLINCEIIMSKVK
ncbi:hypothetical protein COOONC_27381 [Cooperia oncophora]